MKPYEMRQVMTRQIQAPQLGSSLTVTFRLVKITFVEDVQERGDPKTAFRFIKFLVLAAAMIVDTDIVAR